MMDILVSARLLEIQKFRESRVSKDEFDSRVLGIWSTEKSTDIPSSEIKNTSISNRNRNESTIIKGIKNSLGENNCFLNSIIQNLWHLTSFRSNFLNTDHPNHSHDCVFCSLRDLFKLYGSDEEIVTPTDLRKSLSGKGERFKPGESEDALEVYDVLLDNLHSCLSSQEAECTPLCIIHDVFSLRIEEYYECKCGRKTDPFDYNEWIHYIPVDLILDVWYQNKNYSFLKVLHKVAESDTRPCDICKSDMMLQRNLLNSPDVLSVGLSWSKSNPLTQELEDILDIIDTHINPKDVFNSAISNVYGLKGMLCYSAMHYIAIVKVGRNWIKFDDSTCKVIGASWISVADYLKRGLLQCHTLWYEKLR